MTKEFIPYEQALELKALGFNEPCFKVYDTMGYVQDEQTMLKMGLDYCLAPLYQQAFRWFREKHNLHYFIDVSDGIWFFTRWGFDGYKTYEEAELECLKKLIEITKNGK